MYSVHVLNCQTQFSITFYGNNIHHTEKKFHIHYFFIICSVSLFQLPVVYFFLQLQDVEYAIVPQVFMTECIRFNFLYILPNDLVYSKIIISLKDCNYMI